MTNFTLTEPAAPTIHADTATRYIDNEFHGTCSCGWVSPTGEQDPQSADFESLTHANAANEAAFGPLTVAVTRGAAAVAVAADPGNEIETSIVDAIANLLILASKSGVDLDAAVESAMWHATEDMREARA